MRYIGDAKGSREHMERSNGAYLHCIERYVQPNSSLRSDPVQTCLQQSSLIAHMARPRTAILEDNERYRSPTPEYLKMDRSEPHLLVHQHAKATS